MSANVTYNPADYDPLDTVQGPFASQEYIYESVGPFIIGWAFMLMLYGVAANMTFNYAMSPLFAADGRRIKALVGACFFFLTFQAVVEFGDLYYWSTMQQRSVEGIDVNSIWDGLSLLGLGFVAVLVQSFLLWRACQLIKARIARVAFGTIVGLGIALALAGNLLYTITITRNYLGEPLPDTEEEVNGGGGLTFVASAAVDIVISVTLAILLLREVRSFNRQSDTILRTLAVVSLQSGAFTAASALVAAILVYAQTWTYYYNIFSQPLAPLYMIALLTSLNGRRRVREIRDNDPSNGLAFSLPTIPVSLGSQSGGFGGSGLGSGSGLAPGGRRSTAKAEDEEKASADLQTGLTPRGEPKRTSSHSASLSTLMGAAAIPTLGTTMTPEQYRARKVALITGITGQDGSYLTELLLEKGYEVHGLIRRSSSFNTGRIEHLYKDVHERPRLLLHYGDLTDTTNLVYIMSSVQPTEIYNLAAQSHVKVSFDMAEYTADVDGLGTLRLLDAVRTCGLTNYVRFYQASTSELYGKVVETPQSETTPFYPRSPYGVAKLYAFWIVKNYRESYGMYASNGILFNHESPRRGRTFVTRKISRAVAEISLGQQECLYLGNLSAKRDWGHARDYVEGMWKMLQQDEPEDYVLATGETHPVKEFVEKAFKVVGINIRWEGEIDSIEEVGICAQTGRTLVRVDARYFRPAEVELLHGDPTKAEKELGWKRKVDFDALVLDMVTADVEGAKKADRD